MGGDEKSRSRILVAGVLGVTVVSFPVGYGSTMGEADVVAVAGR